jgi:hypothetical protein
MAFVNLRLEDFPRYINTDKLMLGGRYAVILPADTNIDSYIKWFPVFGLTKDGKQVMSNDSTVFGNTNYGNSRALCRRTYDPVFQENFTVIYFAIIPEDVFNIDPFAKRLNQINSISDLNDGVANAIYGCDRVIANATVNIITDDITKIFV